MLNTASLVILGILSVLVLIPVSDAFAADPNLHGTYSTQITHLNGPTNTITVSNVVATANNNRLIVVGVGLDNTEGDNVTVTNVVYGAAGNCAGVGGQTFTAVPNSVSTGTFTRNEIFTLVAPASGVTCNVVVTLSGNVGNIGGLGADSAAIVYAAVFSNVDQSNPFNSAFTKTATGTSNTSSVIMTTLDEHYLFDITTSSTNNNAGSTSPTTGADQTGFGQFGIQNELLATSFAGGASTQPNVSDGVMSWTWSVANARWGISAIAIRSFDLPSIVSSAAAEEKGSGCAKDCTPPTLGVDKDGRIMVEDGFSYNDYTTDVNLYHTPFPLITVNVGDENVAKLKIYENSGVSALKHVGLAFGLSSGQVFSNSAARIEIDFNFNGSKTVSVYDPENALENIKVETDTVDCSDEIVTQCTLLTIYHTFRAPLEFNIVSTDVWDENLNSWQNTYNHGIYITGDSLNPPKTIDVAFGEKNMRGLYELTQTDIYNRLWIDEFGSVYVDMGNNRFDRILSPANSETRDALTSHGCDRKCNWFIDYKSAQSLLATDTLHKILQNKNITGTLDPPFSFYEHYESRSENNELQKLIVSEILRAANSFDKIYNDHEKPVSKFE